MKRSFRAGLSVMTAVSMLTLPSLTQTSAAASNIHVKIDGAERAFDVAPYLKNNRTLVPLRGVMETLGATVTWEESTRIVTAVKGDTKVQLTIGKNTATINGETFYLDAPSELTDNRTFVPLRFLSEALGADVQWDATNSTALIASGQLNLAMTAEVLTFDPSRSISALSMDMQAQTGEGLVRLDAQGHALPGVAKNWEVSADRLTYTFHLRGDAKWSDGSLVTAQDFEYSWKRTLDPFTASPFKENKPSRLTTTDSRGEGRFFCAR